MVYTLLDLKIYTNQRSRSVTFAYDNFSHDFENRAPDGTLRHFNFMCLGDSAYPLLPFLMTPKLNQPPRSPGALYTDCHVRARYSVERTIGVLKGRWRYLRKERALHYTPEFAGNIISLCLFLMTIYFKYILFQHFITYLF